MGGRVGVYGVIFHGVKTHPCTVPPRLQDGIPHSLNRP